MIRTKACLLIAPAVFACCASTRALAETPEEWVKLGARVHGAFGSFIPSASASGVCRHLSEAIDLVTIIPPRGAGISAVAAARAQRALTARANLRRNVRACRAKGPPQLPGRGVFPGSSVAMMSSMSSTTSNGPDSRAQALVASYARAGYAQIEPPVVQPAEPFLDLSGEDTAAECSH